ncbi:aldose epimerase family protein [Alteromonas halophila]|uniref:Aldose 1-epimerase n=1 Tax=Alteromonas halophila TaxID=516698 RepID=A0A918JJ11_9ALTE|nr:aldose epimerase family protein [Alteromonas halophila]GGW81024.1 aldose 1-epimerase [Alteromonas halophila]
MQATQSTFGTLDGESVSCFTLQNAAGMRVSILDLGGIIQGLWVPDRYQNPHRCVQGFDSVAAYLEDTGYQGAIVGRYANRIGHGTFSLDGKTYQLDINGGEHHLHGGFSGFHQRRWQSELISEADASGVRLSLTSKDGEAGFPGTLNITAEYRLYEDCRLTLTLHADTSAPTPVSMTQHAYFSLSNEVVTESFLQLNANAMTAVDASLLPTGEIIPVAASPFDFRRLTRIGDNVRAGHPLFDQVGGYDHNFVLNVGSGEPSATLYAPDTGICMMLSTSMPGMQVYTGSLKDTQGSTICLEPQFFPDTPNQPTFPDCIVRPQTPYQATISYQFSVR